ncbi:MAG: tetratricopeptide repeat protein [Terriglobia bacterium]
MLAPAALRAAPDDALSHFGAGMKLFDLQRLPEAAREFELALQIDPAMSDARYHLAVCHFRDRHYAEARKEFDKLAALNFKEDWTTYYLARLDLIEGNPDAAIAGFQSLKRSEPLTDELYYLGVAYLKKGEPAKAADIFRRQIAFNPRDFRAHDQLGRAYVKLGRPADAEREFEQTRRLHEYYREGKTELMECRRELEQGKPEVAWKTCGAALSSDDIDRLVAAGMIFGEFGQYERALQLFGKALELDPESPEASFDLGLTYYRMKDYPHAQIFLASAVKNRPGFFEAVALYGTVLYLLREDGPAEEALRRAHQLRPEDSAVKNLLAALEQSKQK